MIPKKADERNVLPPVVASSIACPGQKTKLTTGRSLPLGVRNIGIKPQRPRVEFIQKN